MCAAPPEDDAFNGSCAAITRLACAAEYLYRILHVPFFPVRLDVVGNARPFAGYSFPQHLLDTGVQGLYFCCCKRICATCGQQPGMKKGFIGIDIAYAGYERLVK